MAKTRRTTTIWDLVYLQNGEKDKARDSLKQALTLNPSFDGAADAQKVLASL